VFQLSFPKSISSCFQCLLTIGQEEREIVWMRIHKMHTNKQTLSICISVYLFLSYFFHSFQKFLSISPYFTPVPILFLYKSLSKDTLLHKKCIYTQTHTHTHTHIHTHTHTHTHTHIHTHTMRIHVGMFRCWFWWNR
jgi:hypothetical protein